MWVCYKCSINAFIMLIVLNPAEWNWISSMKILHKWTRNPAILDTSNEFIGLNIEVHSGVFIPDSHQKYVWIVYKLKMSDVEQGWTCLIKNSHLFHVWKMSIMKTFTPDSGLKFLNFEPPLTSMKTHLMVWWK